MEKYTEVLIFLAFAAFSLLSQFLKRKKKAVTRAPEQEAQRDFRHPRPSTTREPTFRDILREMTGQPPEAYEEDENDYELPPYLQEKKEEIGTPPPPHLVEAVPKKLADKISLEDDGKRIKPITPITPIKGRKRKRSIAAAMGRYLRNPNNAKRAIILGEILPRKYT